MKKKNLFPLLIALSSVLSLTSCGLDYFDEKEKTLDPVLLVSSNQNELEIGEKWQIDYRLINATGKPEFASSDAKVATVDQNGVVTALSLGTCTISLKFGEKLQSCSLTVSSNKQYSIYTSLDEIVLFIGGKYSINPILKKGIDDTILDATYTYKIEDVSLASMNGNVIEGVEEGITNVLITTTYMDIDYYKLVPVRVNPSYYIDAPKSFSLDFHNGAECDFPEVTIRDVLTNEEVPGMKVTFESDSELLTVDNTNKKIHLLNYGNTELTVRCNNIYKDVPTTVSHGIPQKEEYFYLWSPEDGKNFKAMVFNNKAAANQPDAPQVCINTLGGDHLGEYVMKTGSNKGVNNQAVKYIGVYFSPLKTKAELQALKDEGYKYISFDYLKEAETVGNTWHMRYCSLNNYEEQKSSFVHRGAEDLNKWINFKAPIEAVIECYDRLFVDDKGETDLPFFACATEDRSVKYNLYFTGFEIVK